jgi:hypothetical protein
MESSTYLLTFWLGFKPKSSKTGACTPSGSSLEVVSSFRTRLLIPRSHYLEVSFPCLPLVLNSAAGTSRSNWLAVGVPRLEVAGSTLESSTASGFPIFFFLCLRDFACYCPVKHLINAFFIFLFSSSILSTRGCAVPMLAGVHEPDNSECKHMFPVPARRSLAPPRTPTPVPAM